MHFNSFLYLTHFHNHGRFFLLLLLLFQHGTFFWIVEFIGGVETVPVGSATHAQTSHAAATAPTAVHGAEDGAARIILQVGFGNGLTPEVVDTGELHECSEDKCRAHAHPDIDGLKTEGSIEISKNSATFFVSS